jgi:hypothetical protein
VQSTAGITVCQLPDAFKKEIAPSCRSPQVSDGAVLESVLPPRNSGGHFNCWPAFLFGATKTIMLWTLGDLVHAGRTTPQSR